MVKPKDIVCVPRGSMVYCLCSDETREKKEKKAEIWLKNVSNG